MFEAAPELLGLSEKLQVVVSNSAFLSLLFGLNQRRDRWLGPTQLLGWLFLGT